MSSWLTLFCFLCLLTVIVSCERRSVLISLSSLLYCSSSSFSSLPITGNNHSKQTEEAEKSQSRRHLWKAQPHHHALRHITTINMFFFKTYSCFIWSKIAIRKGSTATIISYVDCSTLQTSRPNHPTTYTYKHTETTVSPCRHAFIHSFIHSIYHIHSITLSQGRTKHHHCHS